MKTLVLHINDGIYDKVVGFLSLFSPEKIKIEGDQSQLFSTAYMNKQEVEQINKTLASLQFPLLAQSEKISLVYDEDDFMDDIDNLKNLNLLQ